MSAAGRKRDRQTPAVLTSRSAARLLRAGRFVLVEPAARLLSEPACGHEVTEHRRRAVLVVTDVAVKDVGDCEDRVEADEVGELEGTHRVIEAKLRTRVDVLRCADAFLEREAR